MSDQHRRNLITDVEGVLVGNAGDDVLCSGVTAVVLARPAAASCAVLGGAAATRDTHALEPDAVVEAIDAIVLSGGSGFGLDAASGAQAWLREQERGFAVGPARVPIVPSAICFDLLNGGDKAWGRYPPYRELGYQAAVAAGTGFALGSVGAGLGATTVSLRGGLGSASATTRDGHTVGALAVVNALGSAVIGAGPHFWAAPLEEGGELGGLGWPSRIAPRDRALAWKGGRSPATTLAVVATDAALSKAGLKRLAIAAHDGFARALRPAHALFDGDTIFAVSTGARPLGSDAAADRIEIGAVAADCVARAIARGVYEAAPASGTYTGPPAWRERFPPGSP